MTEERFIAPALAQRALEESRVFASEDSPFRGGFAPGDNRILVIVGENASGKSLLFRLIAAYTSRDHKATAVTISIRERTDASVPFRRLFMFGDEGEQSTGATSFKTIVNGFENVNRGDQGQALLMLDEPEIGLSDGYASALGEYLGQRAQDLAQSCLGLVVVTHNRALVRGLHAGLGAVPAFARLGSDEDPNFTEWLEERETRSVADLFNLKEIGLERWRTVNKLLNDK